jgi:hypothetical protein
MAIRPECPQGIAAVNTAVLEIYDAVRAVFFSCFPTTTNLTGKLPHNEAKARLDRLGAALQPFPEKYIRFDPFHNLYGRPMPLGIPGSIGDMRPLLNENVEGGSLHDAVVRFSWKICDRLCLAKLRPHTDPDTGETRYYPTYTHGHEYEDTIEIDGKQVATKVTCIGPRIEAYHYSEYPWTPEVWDRIYDEFGMNLCAYCLGCSWFNPHPGQLREGLIKEMNHGLIMGRGKIEPVVVQPLHQREQSAPAVTPATPIMMASRRRMTPEDAENKADELVNDPSTRTKFLSLNDTGQAKMIGCDPRTWPKARNYSLYTTSKGKTKPPSGRKPLAVGSTDTIEANAKATEREEALNKLTEEHQKDFEPSPLDDSPRRVRYRKEV